MSKVGDVTHTKFESWMHKLKEISVPIRIEDNMDYQESAIKQYYKPKTKCFICQQENRYSVLPEFTKAYKHLSIDEKVDFYSSMA